MSYEYNMGYDPANNPFQMAPFQMAPLQSSAISAQGNTQAQAGAVNGQTGLPNNLAGNLQLGVGAIQTLGTLWNSYQQQKLAKKALNFQIGAYKTNLANQTKSYNTALEDRIRARYATEGRSEEADGYINKNKL